MRHIFGPTQNANIIEPMPALPIHHHADTPCVYARAATPTVEPAPKFAAIKVVNKSPEFNLRPATKNPSALLTLRPAHAPIINKNIA